jgi:anti-sigma B factor antagonist
VSTREGSIFIECRYGVWVLTMHGEHDVSTEPSLAEELERVTAAGGPVVIDLSDAEFIDSTILGALVSAAGRSGDDEVAVVAPAGREPLRLVRLTGADSVLRVCETCEAAIEAVAPARDSMLNAVRTIEPGLASSSATPSEAS